MKMDLLNLSRHLLPKHLHTWGNREHVMNAAVTRNRELKSRSGLTCEQQMGWRGGETPLAILFFFLREKRDVSGSDFFLAYYGVKKSSLTPLTERQGSHS